MGYTIICFVKFLLLWQLRYYCAQNISYNVLSMYRPSEAWGPGHSPTCPTLRMALLALDPLMRGMNPIHLHTLFFKIHVNIILSSTPRSSRWFLLSCFLTNMLKLIGAFLQHLVTRQHLPSETVLLPFLCPFFPHGIVTYILFT
jgi:hypothetical protein